MSGTPAEKLSAKTPQPLAGKRLGDSRGKGRGFLKSNGTVLKTKKLQTLL
ncbi:hypothetical protein [Peribacillus frigoritolerans]|nr:hypothetical protein [Peribacillus frigoritolerans]USK74521.1 hypothetical protein LIT31_22515 [Peribacillus frigoritolerans]